MSSNVAHCGGQTDCTSRLLVAVGVATALALSLVLLPPPPGAEAAAGCTVKNKASGRTYSSLQRAVNAAKPRQTLLLSGTCRGKAHISKDITIKGVAAGARGRPTILGWKDFGRILKVRGVAVSLQSLVIDSGVKRLPNRPWHKGAGGAIKNSGTLVLHDVIIRNYHAPNEGGGVFNRGTLILNGRTRITNNRATSGGGVYNATKGSRLVMNDSSRIIGNRGGGVVNNGGLVSMHDHSAIVGNSDVGVAYGDRYEGDRLVLNDSSRISGNSGGGVLGTVVVMKDSSVISNNTARVIAGVWADSLTMTGSSVIRFNTARRWGGGVYRSDEAQTLTGVRCAPDASANVYANKPDDCIVRERWGP